MFDFLRNGNCICREKLGYRKIVVYLQLNTKTDMCTRQQCIVRLSEAAPYIQKEFGVRSLCIFGSMARGDNNELSDVDLCGDMPPKALRVSALKNYLQDLLGVVVDLVRRRPGLDVFLSEEIKRDGIFIFS